LHGKTGVFDLILFWEIAILQGIHSPKGSTMNNGQTVFSQVMDFVPAYEFNQCVERYHGSYKVQNFSCWDHFLCMAFAISINTDAKSA